MFRWKAVLAGLILISGWEVCLGQTPGTIFTVAGIGVGDGLTATAVQLVSPVGVAVDGQGNLYIADSGHSHVRKVDTFGIISTVAGNGTTGFSGDGGPATEAQLSNFEGIAVDGQGNLYIADWGNGRIRKVDSEGIISTVVGGGTGDSSGDGEPALGAQLLSPSGVAVDAQGNIYITEYEGHRIRKVDSAGIISTVAGNGTAGFSGDGGPATEAQLGNPEWVAVDGQGNLFIADAGNRRLRKVDSAGIISTVAGSGTEGFSGDGGPATAAQLSYPEWVAVDAQGSLFIADRDNHRLRKVDNAGIISTVAGNGTPGFSGDGGPATAAQLNGPFAVAVGVQGNLFLADAGNHRIRKVDNAGIISTVAGGSVGDGLPATEAQLFLPLVVSVDGQGNFYIADFANHRIRKVDSAGIISTVAGNGTGGFSGDGRTATEVQLNLPSGVSVDGQGNLFIADRDNHRIRKVDPFGIISTVVGNGTSGFSGDGGEATQAQLNAPVEVVVDAQGNLFIADRGNHRIRKVSSWGTISTVAGEGTAGFSGDGGLATEAQLSLPSGVAVDGQGNLFIADLDNHRIRKVDSTGIISTVAGEGTADFSGDGGPATAAQLSGPAGVAVDGYGNLYIADRDNHRTRKVDTFGIISTVAGNGTAGFSGDGGPATAAQLSGPAGVTMDYLGNLFIADEANHRIRKVVSPALLAHSLPLPGAPLYPDSRITVVFDWPVDFSSVSTTTFVVEGSASGPISGTVTHDPASNSATFFPGAALQVGETVRVRLSGVVLDGDGDGDGDGPPVGELSWTFPVEASLVMTAYPVVAPPGLDGRLEAGEYAAAVPVYVELSSPYTLPGIVPVYPLPESAADLSFTAYLVYTATDLYVAVEVADEAIIDDPEQSWEDDDVELFFDGDRVSNDLAVGNANAEGGHFWVDAGGVDAGGEGLERGVAWFSAVNTRTGGGVAEFRIPLASLDTEDGPGVRAPGAGDTMGFNITVGDGRATGAGCT
ncbi:MAG: Ig-like domain-containing protein [Candidatus Latescibacteria bacterium]|nr:Ig-like domain-containing protein [Candidatus Latescibacterota bacterium]